MLTTPEKIREAAAGFDALGADELMLYCWSTDPNQVDRITEAVTP